MLDGLLEKKATDTTSFFAPSSLFSEIAGKEPKKIQLEADTQHGKFQSEPLKF